MWEFLKDLFNFTYNFTLDVFELSFSLLICTLIVGGALLKIADNIREKELLEKAEKAQKLLDSESLKITESAENVEELNFSWMEFFLSNLIYLFFFCILLFLSVYFYKNKKHINNIS